MIAFAETIRKNYQTIILIAVVIGLVLGAFTIAPGKTFKDDPSHEAAIQLAKWIVDEGIKLLITNEISPQSREVLENADVVVYQAKEGAVLTLVEKARNGMVKNE